MAVTANLFSQFPLNLGGGDTSGEGPMDLLSDTLKWGLYVAAASVSQTADALKADLGTEVANGNGYTTGGVTLASKTYATSSLATTFDAADPTWTATTFTHRYGVLYDDTPTSPADPLIGFVDNGGDVTTAATDLIYAINASGIFVITVA